MPSYRFYQVTKYYWDKELGEMPRDLGIKRYPKVYDKKGYYSYLLDRMHDHQDSFISFYSDREIEERKVDKLFIDVDSKVGSEIILNNMQLFMNVFWESIEVYFSGKKGFHVILHIEPTSFDAMLRQRERLYDVFTTWLQFPLDKITFLNIRQLERIPFSIHPKTLKWKIPIHHSWSYDTILSHSENPQLYVKDFAPLTTKPIIPTSWNKFIINPKNFLMFI